MAEAVVRAGAPLSTVKTRCRDGLRKLRDVLALMEGTATSTFGAWAPAPR